MIPLDQIAEALGGEVSGGQVLAPGPNHSAADRSLSVKLDDTAPEGFVVHSFADDDPISCRDHVRQKLGLPEFKPKSKAKAGGEWKLIREHVYQAADGTPHIRKQKKIDPKGERQFPQAHWIDCQWVKNLPKGWPKLLYRLPELLKAPQNSIAYVTEGERDADTLAALEFTATTAGGVTSEWTPELAEPLKGRRVVILVDADRPGREYGEKVARALHKMAASVKVVDLYPDRTDGSDVTDFVATDRAGVKFIRAVNEAEEWEPGPEAEGDEAGGESDADDKLIAELAELPTVQYERRRKKAAEQLGVRAPILDRLVAAERSKLGLDEDDGRLQGRAIVFAEPEAWPDEVDGAALLDEVAAAIGDHVIMPEHTRHIVTLWVVHTYLLDRFQITPRLAIRSPVKRCGKTTLLDVLSCLVLRQLLAANVTASVIFRVVEAHRPCLLVDEADRALRDNEELRQVFDSGHRANGVALRNVGDDHEPRQFSTYSALAIAAIGNALPDTTADRSIEVNLKRRKPDEAIKPFRLNRTGHLDVLARRIRRWVEDNGERIGQTEPAMPASVFNRDADNWHPLLAIAEAAGGDWPERAPAAAASAAAKMDDAQSRTEVLLGDIRDVFAAREKNKVEPMDEVASAALVEALIGVEGRPWAEFGKTGKPLTQNKLARMLKPLGIAPEPIGPEDARVRGYKLTSFYEAFERYPPSKGASKPSSRPERDKQGTSDLFQSVQPRPAGRFEKSEKSNSDGLLDTWTVAEVETGEEEEIESRPSDAPDLPPGAVLVGRAPPGERCCLCGKAGRVFLVRQRGGVDQLHLECAKAEPNRTTGNGAEPGLPHATIEKLAAWYSDAAADQFHETGDVDRAALDAELRRLLAEREHVYPEFIEVEFNRIMTAVFGS